MQRFTIDGSDDLEERLGQLCERVLQAVQRVIPQRRLEALVLGGGYGRGQGGVLKENGEDRPYNDLEFYIFVRGSRLLSERRTGPALGLSPGAGVHIEFKIESLPHWQTSPISMFSYDLVSGHRILHGNADLFSDCKHHRDPTEIPLSEATRLLFNRCSGLLLAREMLSASALSTEQSDFIGRNLAKARLALGDALLAALGQYHWSCLERGTRVEALGDGGWRGTGDLPARLPEVQRHHRNGVQFKLHPQRILKPAAEFREEHSQLSNLAQQVWLWIENRRLAGSFDSPCEYALAAIEKCPGTNPWRNWLLNLNTFGFRGVLDRRGWRYPRERLLNSLPLLLWNGEITKDPEVLHHLQRELHSQSCDWSGFVRAYQKIWSGYG